MSLIPPELPPIASPPPEALPAHEAVVAPSESTTRALGDTALGQFVQKWWKIGQLTRYYWRDETLYGTDGTGPSRFDTKNVPGLIDHDRFVKGVADMAVHGPFKGRHNIRDERRAAFEESLGLEPLDLDPIPPVRTPPRVVGDENLLSNRTVVSLAHQQTGKKGKTQVHADSPTPALFPKRTPVPRDPEVPFPVTYRQRFLAGRRQAQETKLNNQRALQTARQSALGTDIHLTTRQQRARRDERGERIPVREGDFWENRDRKGAAKAQRKSMRRVKTGGRLRLTMGESRLKRAARGDTIPGWYREQKIDRLRRRHYRAERRLGIRNPRDPRLHPDRYSIGLL